LGQALAWALVFFDQFSGLLYIGFSEVMAPNTGVTKHRTGRTVHTILTGSKYVILLILYGPQLSQPDQMLCLGAMVQ